MEIDRIFDWIAVALTSLLFASFAIFEVIAGGRYVFVGLAGAVLLLKCRGKINLSLNPYYIFNILLIIYATLSSLWAWNSSYSLEMSKRMFDTFLCSVLVYMAYQEDESTELLTLSLKISGYIVMVYAIWYYGPRQLVNMLLDADRMAGEIGNANVYGMTIAYSCLLELLEIVQKRKLTLTCPLIVPSVFVIAATQSRKSLLILGIGLALIVLCYGFNPKHIFRSVLLFVCIGFIAVFVLKRLEKVPFFSGIISRMELITNYIQGEDGVGYSIRERSNMIQIGWEQFLKTPIGGIGFGNALVLTALQNDVVYTYLHNNFIELLCCGGAVGFAIYYARYFYIFIMLMKNFHMGKDMVFTCGTLLTIIVIMDYGFVSYYSKMIQGFQILMFLQVALLNKAETRVPKTKDMPMHKYLRA